MIDQELLERAKDIRLLILDVDGVLTDGSIILDNNGNELKAFHVRDGHGIKMLQKVGIEIAIITGRRADVVERRASELGIQHVYQGVLNKAAAYADLQEKTGIPASAIACVGDDIVDIPLLRRAALSVAVADATEETRAAAAYVTKARGGRGAVREVCDLILKATGKWDQLLNAYRNS
ncbi:MAG: 3-deoxy-manno-octulosonate-8-phosphatase KdsC [Nitrospiraceae bacterium]|jgi:3-deoxy-D-manno-octulosonate 8-phosphate phosphatase (KDO 8-P phosphatase)|nr:3-deoxy-manno-octulosonate-8-phosphatase KdsC [Nitrospiraceae bacterium]